MVQEAAGSRTGFRHGDPAENRIGYQIRMIRGAGDVAIDIDQTVTVSQTTSRIGCMTLQYIAILCMRMRTPCQRRARAHLIQQLIVVAAAALAGAAAAAAAAAKSRAAIIELELELEIQNLQLSLNLKLSLSLRSCTRLYRLPQFWGWSDSQGPGHGPVLRVGTAGPGLNRARFEFAAGALAVR